MKPISIREASSMMQKPEQFVRVSISMGMIPGAFYIKGEGKQRGSYYITDDQVKNLMKGARE